MLRKILNSVSSNALRVRTCRVLNPYILVFGYLMGGF